MKENPLRALGVALGTIVGLEGRDGLTVVCDQRRQCRFDATADDDSQQRLDGSIDGTHLVL